MLGMAHTMPPMECWTYQAYNDVINGEADIKGESKVLKGPAPMTLPHNPQPQATAHDYDW